MQYDQMFLVGAILMGVALLAASMFMSGRDWLASAVMTLMVVAVVAIISLSPKINLITIVFVIAVILGGVSIWNLRMQRIGSARTKKPD